MSTRPNTIHAALASRAPNAPSRTRFKEDTLIPRPDLCSPMRDDAIQRGTLHPCAPKWPCGRGSARYATKMIGRGRGCHDVHGTDTARAVRSRSADGYRAGRRWLRVALPQVRDCRAGAGKQRRSAAGAVSHGSTQPQIAVTVPLAPPPQPNTVDDSPLVEPAVTKGNEGSQSRNGEAKSD
jgi:hypothetical protein